MAESPIYDKELQSENVAKQNPTVNELTALGIVVNTVKAGQGILFTRSTAVKNMV